MMIAPRGRPITANIDLATTDTGTIDLLTPKGANWTIYIRHIVIAPHTFAAKTLTFQDSATSPVKVGAITLPASQGSTAGHQEYTIDYLDDGTPLTMGKKLQMAISGAGIGARIHVSAYQIESI